MVEKFVRLSRDMMPQSQRRALSSGVTVILILEGNVEMSIRKLRLISYLWVLDQGHAWATAHSLSDEISNYNYHRAVHLSTATFVLRPISYSFYKNTRFSDRKLPYWGIFDNFKTEWEKFLSIGQIGGYERISLYNKQKKLWSLFLL